MFARVRSAAVAAIRDRDARAAYAALAGGVVGSGYFGYILYNASERPEVQSAGATFGAGLGYWVGSTLSRSLVLNPRSTVAVGVLVTGISQGSLMLAQRYPKQTPASRNAPDVSNVFNAHAQLSDRASQ